MRVKIVELQEGNIFLAVWPATDETSFHLGSASLAFVFDDCKLCLFGKTVESTNIGLDSAFEI